eukprot:1179283-Prorocentrum_minimum.AAC.2
MLKYISPGSGPGQEYHSQGIELEWRLDNFICMRPGIGGKTANHLTCTPNRNTPCVDHATLDK